ncbi:hypothetical protein KAR91_27710 [Candidatus Pacearchaeota archaeon]|nr:hypothetical protein [Candidatus Pacearchaeota archaeon]
MAIDYKALWEMAKVEAKEQCDLMYPFDNEFCKDMRTEHEMRLIIKYYRERVCP